MADKRNNLDNSPVRIGVLGAGMWGESLVRNVFQCPTAELVAVCDVDSVARSRTTERYPDVRVVSSYDKMLDVDGLDAVIVATPPAMHFEHAQQALEANKHVLVEKPFCTNGADAATLCRVADERSRVLMCGHTVLYNNIVHDVKRRMEDGELGDIRYLYCRRLNLGRVRPDVDALWNLAPHDISMMCFLLDAWPIAVNARGWCYVQPDRDIADVCFFQMEFEGGIAVSGHVSWLDPQKERSVVVVGSERMLIYDDLNPSRTLQVFDKSVEVGFQDPMGGFADFNSRVRAGDLVIPNVRQKEPLAEEIAHYADCIRTGATPLSGGRQSLYLVNVLEAMSRSMRDGGCNVEVEYADASATITPTLLSSATASIRKVYPCRKSPLSISTPNTVNSETNSTPPSAAS